jgi:hypothetical protein
LCARPRSLEEDVFSWKLAGIKEGPGPSVEVSPALGSHAAYYRCS